MEWTQMLTPALGPVGLLGVVVILILTGRLIPKTGVDERLADKDKQITTWQKAYEGALAVQEVQRAHITELLDATRTTTHVIQALPRAASLNERSSRASGLAEEDA
jgi:hypothetical protein